jgi:hypothetical protein
MPTPKKTLKQNDLRTMARLAKQGVPLRTVHALVIQAYMNARYGHVGLTTNEAIDLVDALNDVDVFYREYV